MINLYDNIIEEISSLTASSGVHITAGGTGCSVHEWPVVTDRSMILKSDMAYELGGGQNIGIGTTLVTTSAKLCSTDSVSVLGDDLQSIASDRSFARIVTVKVSENFDFTGEKLYSAIRNFEYIRYRVYPEGYMTRASSALSRESVRVSKEAVKKGISFSHVGALLIDELKKNKLVENVSVCFVTAPSFDYKSLRKLTEKSEAITGTIDHILKTEAMDCKVCSLQEICDEVEGLRELHFGMSK